MLRDKQITECTAKTIEDVGKKLLDLAEQVRQRGVVLLEASEAPIAVVHSLPDVKLLQFPTGKPVQGVLECAHMLRFNSFGFWLAQCPRTKEFFFKPEDNPEPPHYVVAEGQMQ